jgi:type I restriction enzyme S subunit
VRAVRDYAAAGRDNFIDGDWIETPYITDQGIRLIQTGNIGRGVFLDKPESKRFISKRSFETLGCRWVMPNDLLICRLADPIGRACIVPERVGWSVTAVDCTIVRVAESADLAFVVQVLNDESHLKRAADAAGGSTRQRISRSQLGALPSPHPPRSEQVEIGRRLQALDRRLVEEERTRTAHQKVRSGLMDDLLTGRVRVTPLLDEAAE